MKPEQLIAGVGVLSGYYPKITPNKEYICPTCGSTHYDSRGFCLAKCFKEMKEKQKIGKQRMAVNHSPYYRRAD